MLIETKSKQQALVFNDFDKMLSFKFLDKMEKEPLRNPKINDDAFKLAEDCLKLAVK
jgi:AAA+ ATPase superfamily predicted ATPase